jgi:hypothetical protein
MTVTSLLLTWLAPQVPLAVPAGKFIKLGMGRHKTRALARQSKLPPGIVWC